VRSKDDKMANLI